MLMVPPDLRPGFTVHHSGSFGLRPLIRAGLHHSLRVSLD